jgi:hypothetical protein
LQKNKYVLTQQNYITPTSQFLPQALLELDLQRIINAVVRDERAPVGIRGACVHGGILSVLNRVATRPYGVVVVAGDECAAVVVVDCDV